MIAANSERPMNGDDIEIPLGGGAAAMGPHDREVGGTSRLVLPGADFIGPVRANARKLARNATGRQAALEAFFF